MKIARLETVFVRPRWLFLKVDTDSGLSGWGEPIVAGRARTVATALRELEPLVVGQDPRLIEHLWQRIYRGTFYRGGPVLTSALSGLEQALWDILGKSLGVPVYQLLGGAVRHRIRACGRVNGDEPLRLAEQGRRRRDEGYTAVKVNVPVAAMHALERPQRLDREVARIKSLREAVGSAVDIAIDFHGRLSPALAIQLASALEPYRPLFIEEPCLPENVDSMRQIAQATSIPLATGERLDTKWGFREVLEKQAASILQPDVSHAGGILECRKIAAMAEAHYVSIAPHCAQGPVALAACLQLDACTPNFLVQELATLGEGYLEKPFTLDNGHIPVPTAPGLGIEVNEEAIRKQHKHDGSWQPPQWTLDDGAVADW